MSPAVTLRRIHPGDDLAPAAEALRHGAIVCYPTETFYALGADPWNPEAVDRLRLVKKRPDDKELPLIVADPSMVAAFCVTSDARLQELMKRFWPGPLTLVLPSRSGPGSFAVRVSPHPVAQQLSAQLGGPIVSTSANLSGEPPVEDPAQLNPELLQGIDWLVDGGRCPGGRPSTIVSLLSHPAAVLREGAIPAADLQAFL